MKSKPFITVEQGSSGDAGVITSNGDSQTTVSSVATRGVSDVFGFDSGAKIRASGTSVGFGVGENLSGGRASSGGKFEYGFTGD